MLHCPDAGLTKMVSRLGKEGSWRKALEIYQGLPQTGVCPDTAITNAAISACDKGVPAPPILSATAHVHSHFESCLNVTVKLKQLVTYFAVLWFSRASQLAVAGSPHTQAADTL